jgi:hypothetical protein
MLLEIASVNRGLRGEKQKDLTKKLVKSYMVGNIDLSSNQVFDFLQNFIAFKELAIFISLFLSRIF